MRELDLSQVQDVARGAGILGGGGGGDPYIGRLLAEAAITKHGAVTVADIDEVPADAVVAAIAMFGAPTIIVEKPPSGREALTALRTLEKAVGKDVTHVLSIEIGGLNSMIPLAVAAETGLPIVDADAMGRAFPEAQMVLPSLIGVTISPMAIADEKGNTTLVEAASDAWAERMARSVCVTSGCSVFIAGVMMTGAQLADGLVHGSLRLAGGLGGAVRVARETKRDPVAAVVDQLGGTRLFTGKVTDVDRVTTGGFAKGAALIEGVGTDRGRQARLRFQNEFLVAEMSSAAGGADLEVVATTPDLICVLETDTGEPVNTENIRYGNRITVIGVSCDPRWKTPEGLRRVGPRYFGYDFDHRRFPTDAQLVDAR